MGGGGLLANLGSKMSAVFTRIERLSGNLWPWNLAPRVAIIYLSFFCTSSNCVFLVKLGHLGHTIAHRNRDGCHGDDLVRVRSICAPHLRHSCERWCCPYGPRTYQNHTYAPGEH